MIKFLDLKKQYLSIKKEIDKSINEVINTSSFIGGKKLKLFEKNFSKFLNAKYCIGVANGTDALEIAIEAFNFKSGSEIIVPCNSWISSAEAVSRNNLKPIFVDINNDDFTINIEHLKKKITKKTCAIMAVHLYGHPCDMKEILRIAKKLNLKIIEDCAQSHGSKINNKSVGTFGHISTFSFYPGKNLGAYGDGGAIVTNSTYLAKKCKKIANHGGLKKNQHDLIGRNSRLDNIQASIINVKLKYLSQFNKKRNKLALIYYSELKNNNHIELPINNKNIFHTYHLFVLKVKNRNKLIKFLNNKGISTSIHYPKILPRLKPYNTLNLNNNFPISENISKRILSLPLHEMLEVKDVKRICLNINNFYNT